MNGDIIQISVQGSGPAGSAITNTFHYKDLTGGALPYDPLIVASDFYAGIMQDLFACVADTYRLVKIVVSGLDGPSGLLSGELLGINTDLGLLGGPYQEESTAVILKRFTGYRGPKERGRIFIGPVANSLLFDIPSGIVDIASAPLLQMVNDLIADQLLDVINWTPVLVHTAETIVTASKPLRFGEIGEVCTNLKSRRFRFPN